MLKQGKGKSEKEPIAQGNNQSEDAKRKQKLSSIPEKKTNKRKPGSNIVTLSDYENNDAQEKRNDGMEQFQTHFNQLGETVLTMQDEQRADTKKLTHKVDGIIENMKNTSKVIAKAKEKNKRDKQWIAENQKILDQMKRRKSQNVPIAQDNNQSEDVLAEANNEQMQLANGAVAQHNNQSGNVPVDRSNQQMRPLAFLYKHKKGYWCRILCWVFLLLYWTKTYITTSS